jgi:DNA-binding NarL/FixJ family response regulator
MPSFSSPAATGSLTAVQTILVASDAAAVRREVGAVIEGPDVTVVDIHTGPEVPAAVHDHAPGLLVVDLQMGNMGGMAVCLELRLEESYGNLPHVPVLMLLDRRADVFLAKRSGAEGFIVKPLDPMRIRRATAALLAGGQYHDESFQPVPSQVAGPAATPAVPVTTTGA